MTIDVAILGCAHLPHARSYAAAVSAGRSGTLVAVHDPAPELGHPLAQQHGVRYYQDAAELLRAQHPRAVIVCSETAQHRTLVELAASSGAHVLCEKPLATTTTDAVAITDCCRQAGVHLQTAFVSRFYPVVQEIRDVVRQGELGDVRVLVGGNRGTAPLAPKYPGWITDADQAGGGALIDHAVHVVDVMRFVCGLEVTSAMAEAGSLFTDLAVEDSALLSLVFQNGAVGSVDPSWSVTRSNPWEYDFYLRILGSKGALSIASGPESIGVVGDADGRSFRHASFEPDINRAMVDAFLESVQRGEIVDPCATGDDGVRAAEVVQAAYASVPTRRLTSVSSAPI